MWVYAEHRRGSIARCTLELLGAARRIASRLGCSLSAVLMGWGVGGLAQTLIEHGADRVYLVEHEALKYYTTQLYAEVLADLVRRERPEVLLFSATTTGRDLAPRVAAKLETGLTADCTDLGVGDYRAPEGRVYRNLLYQVRPAFGGDVMATIVTPDRRPQMATVRPGAFEVPKPDPSRAGEVVRVPVRLGAGDPPVEVIEAVVDESEVCLEDARVIVAGGRGVGGPRGFELIRRLARLLGGQVGASRAAVDAGWISREHQIGLTGRSVRPDVYIACGISGALQHMVGVKNAKVIIAINKDPEAPIFDFADYGIVGDVFEVLPVLIARIEEARRVGQI